MSLDKKLQLLDVDIFNDLKAPVVRRLLRQAYMSQREDSLPMHRRKSGGEDEVTEDQDEEREKTAELHASRGKPAPIPVSDEDVSENTAAKMMPPMPKAKKGKA